MKTPWVSTLLKMIVFMLVLLPFDSVADDAPISAEVDVEAIDVVESYLQALIVGDIPGIKRTLGAGLLQEKKFALDSPAYDATLREMYAGASYSIVDAQWVTVEQARVDAEILDGQGNVMEASFLVMRGPDGVFFIDQELK